MSKPQIDIISSDKIDHKKWNACIAESKNPLIYACSFYLDYMATNWDGIIINDYEAVMPVPWRKKFGIRYTYTVPFIQQLGIFSSSKEKYKELFLQQLFIFSKYGDYNFNYSNLINTTGRTNFTIDLSSSYNDIAKAYKTDLVNNLRKAIKEDLVYKKGTDYKKAIAFYKEIYASRFAKTTEEDYNRFENLCTHLSQTDHVIVRSVVNSADELLAIALFLNDGHRIYNMMNTTLDKGRKTEANHFLFDQVLEEFAGSKLIFDFEGSDIPGVKSFYKKFGAIDQPYYSLHFNKLSPLIRWIKK
jgi:hypothetical protein